MFGCARFSGLQMCEGFFEGYDVELETAVHFALLDAGHTEFYVSVVFGHFVGFENHVPHREHKREILVPMIGMTTVVDVMVGG